MMWIAAPHVAWAYSEPMLQNVIPAMGIAALLQGCVSTKLDLARRNIQAARVTILELANQAFGLFATVVIAWIFPSPWALVWGNVLSAATRTVGSHVFLSGPTNRFAWDRSAVSELLSFGGWVLLSSTLTYLVSEGRTLLTGALV